MSTGQARHRPAAGGGHRALRPRARTRPSSCSTSGRTGPIASTTRRGRTFVLRVHRHGYHTAPRSSRSSPGSTRCATRTSWRRPTPCAHADGSRVAQLATPELGDRDTSCTSSGSPARAGAEGEGPPGRRSAASARSRRGCTAMHSGGTARTASPLRLGLRRRVRPVARWGRWQDGLAVGPEELEVLGRLDAALQQPARGLRPGPRPLRPGARRPPPGEPARGRRRRASSTSTTAAWGGSSTTSAPPWRSSRTTRGARAHGRVGRGYRSVAALAAADEAEIPTFVMMRRLLLVAWIGSHHTFATEAASWAPTSPRALRARGGYLSNQ